MNHLNYRQYLRRHGIHPLPVASEGLHPASILCRRNRSYFERGRIDRLLDGKEWKACTEKAHITTGTFDRRLSLAGRSSVSYFVLLINGGLSHARSVAYEIKEVTGREFCDSNLLTHRTDEIRKFIRSAKGERFKDCFLAVRLWYATCFEVNFDGMSAGELRVVLRDKLIQGSLKPQLTSRGKIIVSSRPSVPFGFTSFDRLKDM